MSKDTIGRWLTLMERRRPLSPEDREAILTLPCDVRTYGSNEIIVGEEERTTRCCIIDSGLVSRVKALKNGSRQVVAFHLPGDAVDLQSILFTRADHAVYANCQSTVSWITHRDILALAQERPEVARALWLDTLVEASVFREWTANIGQRRAHERIAHLLLELAARFDAIGMLKNQSFDFPVTQPVIAQALGLSLVHFNKSLASLKQSGLLTVSGRTFIIDNKEELVRLSGFSPDYLYLDSSRVEPPEGLQTHLHDGTSAEVVVAK